MIFENRNKFGIKPLCEALDIARSSWYSFMAPKALDYSALIQIPHPRKMTELEEKEILKILNSERFCDMAPPEIYTILLDEGQYLCSQRTMYRILKRCGQTRIRHQSAPKTTIRPELLASRPNELWTWDITKLKGPQKWTYYYLYEIIDVFSRYVVGWMLSYQENSALAKELITQTCLKQKIAPGTLTIHADNGSPMKSKTTGQLLMNLGVTKTHSRPYVSNDNPFSESAFKTLKYRPNFPERFETMETARSYCQKFFVWYNMEHRHESIAMNTPFNVHFGHSEKIKEKRSEVLVEAFINHPERFVKGIPKVRSTPTQVWINNPEQFKKKSVRKLLKT